MRLYDDSDNPRIYRIIRFRFNGKPRTIRKNVTLTEAQNHCSRPDTSSHSTGPGAWFDGYDLMPGCKPPRQEAWPVAAALKEAIEEIDKPECPKCEGTRRTLDFAAIRARAQCSIPNCTNPGAPSSTGQPYCRPHLLILQAFSGRGHTDEEIAAIMLRLVPAQG